MTAEELNVLQQRVIAVAAAVNSLRDELMQRIAERTGLLIAANNDETRGAIKALQEILNLPATLQSERDQMTAALSNEPDADFS